MIWHLLNWDIEKNWKNVFRIVCTFEDNHSHLVHLACHIRFLLIEESYVADDSGDKMHIHKNISAISEVTNIYILFTLFLTY